jgi:Flp pilus assembly protein CpaB
VNRKRLGYILIGGGVILALAVGLLVFNSVAEAERIKTLLPKARVVVAATDIPERAEITAAQIAVRTVPDELVQVGAAQNITDVVGKFTPNAILKGEVINTKRIGPASARNAPSFSIEKGKVMYAMPVSFGGGSFTIAQINALRAGDRIDLLYSTINAPQGLTADQREDVLANPVPYLQTRIMLQDLRVQQIGSYAADGHLIAAGADPAAKDAAAQVANSNIIFIVTPEEALVLKWLKDAATYYRQASNMEIVLRSPADEEKADPNLVINLPYMQQKYNLAPPPTNLTAQQK